LLDKSCNTGQGLPGLYYTKIIAENRLAKKCATLLFEERHPINQRYKHPKFVGLRYVGYVIEWLFGWHIQAALEYQTPIPSNRNKDVTCHPLLEYSQKIELRIFQLENLIDHGRMGGKKKIYKVSGYCFPDSSVSRTNGYSKL
jgi:hypothetical protein